MLKHYLYCFFIAMVPIVELRGAVPVAVAFHAADPAFNIPLAFVLIAIGNMLPVPVLNAEEPAKGYAFAGWKDPDTGEVVFELPDGLDSESTIVLSYEGTSLRKNMIRLSRLTLYVFVFCDAAYQIARSIRRKKGAAK